MQDSSLTGKVRAFTMARILDAFEGLKSRHNIEYSLKPEQTNILSQLVDRNNILAVLPTGTGKSVLYSLLPLILNQVRNVMTSHWFSP